jgi:hypothetical protein
MFRQSSQERRLVVFVWLVNRRIIGIVRVEGLEGFSR